ncbi:MAG: maleylpyruvate isomerase family mycothiol-dependent enzyme [Acidimicrobiales bacterium]
MTLSSDRYIDHIRSESTAMFVAARAVELDARVPGCPDWSVYDLVAHTSGVHRWAAEMVRTRASRPVSRREMPPAPEGAAVIDWFEEGAAELVAALEEAGPDVDVWNWSSDTRSLFWFRRQAQETAVHRWDTESAKGGPRPIPAALAIDGIDELLSLWVPGLAAGQDGTGLGGSFHLHATDDNGEWTILSKGGAVTIESGHGKADAAIRAPASDLLLFLWGRPVEAAVELFGDESIPTRWREQVRI